MKKTFVGIDDGHDGIKIVFNDSTDHIKEFRLPSMAQAGKGNVVDLGTEKLDDMSIIVNTTTGDERYLVDENFVDQKMETRTADYPYNSLNIALIVQALRRAGISNNELSIVAGLPANQYYANGRKNEGLISQKVSSLQNIGRAYSPSDFKKYQANHVSVAPEGYGVAVNLMLDDKLNETQFYEEVKDSGIIIIDIGGRTLDVVTIAAKTCLPKATGLSSYNRGILYLKDELRSALANESGMTSTIPDYMLDRIIKTRQIGKGEGMRDVGHIIDAINQRLVESIYNDVRVVLGSAEAVQGGIVIAGGGSLLLGDALKARIQDSQQGVPTCPVTLIDKPEFANAHGFWKIALDRYGD